MSDDNVQSWEVDFVVGYANHGKQLPRTKEEYCARLHISGDAATRISDYIGPLMAVYAPEQEECQIFYDESYPAASEAASSALAIAQSAVHGHEYGDIVQAIKDIDSAASEERERLQKIIRDGIDAEVETLAHDLDQAQKVLDGLNPLQERTPGDFDALKPCRVTLTSFHAAEQITLDDLNLNLAQLRFRASLVSPGSAVWLALQIRIEECEAIDDRMVYHLRRPEGVA
ncbi:hypothetical protein EV121DRAFT_294022 [Schizophyllum commune]